MTTDTSEAGLEALIVAQMTGAIVAPTGLGFADEPEPFVGLHNWLLGNPADYDRAWTADIAQLRAFLSATQPHLTEAFDLDNDGPVRQKFLDRLQGQLAGLGLAAEWRDALVHLWWLRRQRPRNGNPNALGGYCQVAPLVQQLLCQQLDPNWRESYRQVAAVLGRAVRASSAVECMNSVLRMHQSRHRTLSQGMLDLKRLYWNTRVFRGGKRKGRCPYEHLGLKLPSYRFWDLLWMPIPAVATI